MGLGGVHVAGIRVAAICDIPGGFLLYTVMKG